MTEVGWPEEPLITWNDTILWGSEGERHRAVWRKIKYTVLGHGIWEQTRWGGKIGLDRVGEPKEVLGQASEELLRRALWAMGRTLDLYSDREEKFLWGFVRHNIAYVLRGSL